MTERHKKLVLLALFALATIYSYAAFLVLPLRAEGERLRHEMDLSRDRIRTGSIELNGLRAKELAALAEADVDSKARQLMETMPGPYLVHAPPEISRLLEDHELTNSKVSLFLLLPVRSLPGHVFASWQVQIPEARALAFGAALADLENRFPLGQLTELSLKANATGGTVKASMAFQTVVHP